MTQPGSSVNSGCKRLSGSKRPFPMSPLISSQSPTPKQVYLWTHFIHLTMRNSYLNAGCCNKCCPLDPMPTELTKEIADKLIPVLLSLVKRSLLEGHFPDCFGEALVNPYQKKANSDPNEFNKQCPISKL